MGKNHRALEYIGSQNNQKNKGKIEKAKEKFVYQIPPQEAPNSSQVFPKSSPSSPQLVTN